MVWQFDDLSKDDQNKLHTLLQQIKVESNHFLGYPCTCNFDYSPLFPFLSYPLNNVGDPFVPTLFHLNTHEIEREVLHIFSQWTHATADTWGYITNGGTEGNMYGIFLARELYPDGMLYYSEDTHYSVSKSLRVLHVRNIMIKSQENGEMDYEDLYETIRIHRDVTPIIFANIGTTMKGALDNVVKIREILHNLAIPNYYIHVDAALSGMILPFINNPPDYDFDAGIDSISISGHKMIGSPIPCGVVLAKKTNVDRIARSIEYVGTLDTTLSGSRNAVTPLFLWYALKTVKFEGFRKIIAACLQIADYAIAQFRAVGINAWRNTNSITVVIPRPPQRILETWQLAVQNNIAHIVTMPHVTREHIDALIADIVNEQKQTP
ncbi:MAG: histidine decarboxylase [Gammaproteobacteria bacterium]|nr:histidine decarboxylase [Gammaproteobacteria bacterium]MDH5802406.1 histidine decarboxylase [Gammaproteobacteria bacterium]